MKAQTNVNYRNTKDDKKENFLNKSYFIDNIETCYNVLIPFDIIIQQFRQESQSHQFIQLPINAQRKQF